MNNPEELNRYYKLVNEYIDKYIDDWKIHPKKLDKYFKNNSRLVSFLERSGLTGIKMIEKVIDDVISDRKDMANDGVLTFEGFSVLESSEYRVQKIQECLYKGIDKVTVEHEKVLADHYDKSLSYINVKDSDKHKFIIDGDKYDTKCIVYLKAELEIVKANLIEYSFTKLINETVKVSDIGVELDVSEFVDEDKFNYYMDKKLTIEKVSKSMCSILSAKSSKITKGGSLIIEYV